MRDIKRENMIENSDILLFDILQELRKINSIIVPVPFPEPPKEELKPEEPKEELKPKKKG